MLRRNQEKIVTCKRGKGKENSIGSRVSLQEIFANTSVPIYCWAIKFARL